MNKKLNIFVLLIFVLNLISPLCIRMGLKSFPFVPLALSLNGIEQGFLFQLFTYPLVSAPLFLDLFLLLYELMQLLFLNQVMNALQAIYGWKRSSFFYLGSILAAGLFFLIYSKIFHCSPFLYGTRILFCTLFFLFSCSSYDALWFFWSIPIKAKTFPLLSVLFFLFQGIARGDLSHFIALCGSFLFAYFYMLFILNISSEYAILHPFERFIRQKFWKKEKRCEILDFKTRRKLF